MTPVVLVADDEEHVRSLVALLLTQEGFSVLTACDGQEALKLSREYNGIIDLLITDIDMPHLKGTDLVVRLLQDRPGMKAMLMTGGGGWETTSPILMKPFPAETLRAKVQEVLAAPPRPTAL